jgi:predicted esterase
MNKNTANLHKLTVGKTAHFYTCGNPEEAEHVIFALHGYGQLASRLIQKFNQFDNCVVIAPEGLSSFYWKGVQGDVVASWMTSHHREDEINDYLAYLDKLFRLHSDLMLSKKVHLFGFSQGCATLWRWLEKHQPTINSVCLWAGWLPEDVYYQGMANYLNTIDIRFIYGLQDEYLTEARMEIFRQRVKKEKLDLAYTGYNGKHKVDREVLKDWFESL